VNENNTLERNKSNIKTNGNLRINDDKCFNLTSNSQQIIRDHDNISSPTITLESIQQNLSSIANNNHPLSLMINKFSYLHTSLSKLKLLNLHIWLWNVRSLNNHKFNYLHSLLCGRAYKEIYCPDILSLTETWMNTSGKFKTNNFKNYIHYSTSRTDGRKGRGVSVHIKSNLNSQLINAFSLDFMEAVHVEINLSSSKNLQIIGIYRPPNGCMINFMSFMETLFDTYGVNIVLLGDMNLSETGSSHQTFEDYIDLIHCYGYNRINNATTYFYRSSSMEGSILDHILVNDTIGNCFSLTSQKTTYSDHNILMGTLNMNTRTEGDNKVRKHTNKLDRKKALSDIKSYLQLHEPLGNNLNDKCNHLLNDVAQILQDNTTQISLKTKDINFHPPPWADKSYIELYNKIHNLQEKIWQFETKLLPTNVLRSKFNYLKSKIVEMEKAKTKIYYSNLILSKPKVSWNIINDLCGRKRSVVKINLKVNSVVINNDYNIAQIFHKKFLTSVGHKGTKQSAKHRGPFILNTFQFHEVNDAYIGTLISCLASDKSPGLDEIPASVWKFLSSDVQSTITELINEMIRMDEFPDVLKNAMIVPIHKKGDRCDSKNYRQVSLLPAISKIFEKVLLMQMEEFLEKYNVLDKHQFGFRKNKGCHDAIALVLHKASNEIEKSNGIVLLSLDVASAFDNVSHDILLHKMEYIGIRGKSNNLLRSYLSNRKQCVRIKNAKSEFGVIYRGVPQGSLLGPLIFNLMLNDLMNIKSCSQILKYADDALVLFSVHADSDNLNLNRLQNLLNEIVEFYDDNELVLNSSKSQYLSFGKPGKEGVEIILNSAGFKKCERLTYLGITISNGLNFSSYLEDVVKRLSQTNGVISNIRYKLPIPVLQKFYYGHLHSHLTYCSFVFLRCNKTEILRLQRAQSRALKLIYNLPSTHPTADLFETYVPNVLPVVGIIFYSAIVMVKKYLIEPDEAAFSIAITNSRRVNEIKVHLARSSSKKDDLCCSGIALYNKLPSSLKSIANINQFKRELKMFLLSKRENLLKESQFKDRDLK